MSTATLPSGQSDARYNTTAALAETEASTANLSKEVQQNANQLHSAATDAATTAQVKEPEAISAVNKLEEDLSHKTNDAAAQGAVDVQSAKATATSYVEQAKNLASSAIATAQSYVSGGAPKEGTQTSATGGVTSTVQSAVETGKQYLASAQEAAKPYVESATATAKPYVESAAAAAQPHIEKAKSVVTGATTGTSTTGQPAQPPASTAPLESGPHVVGNPYPATTNGQSTKVAEV
ncbi:hypothetical protein BV20DRAFT_1048351 [Pilatotrama ljubarskyi]|nr:hypothetical protein BV20DRAFT_1048351 [Pilatotrama ljubarskyi]